MTENIENIAPMKPVSLTSAKHKGMRVKQIGSADHLAKNHFAKLYTQEFTKAGADYPIIFIQNPETKEYFAGCMWGLEPGENLFVEEGRWTGGFYPASVRCFPFAMSPDPQNPEQLYIGIYENSEYVNPDEGELIFDDEGNETEWMKGIKEFLVRVYQQERLTNEFIKTLAALDLLVPQSLTIKNNQNEEKRDISGFHVVDREKLGKLSDEKVLELHKNQGMELIHAHLMSLQALDKLVRKKSLKEQGNTDMVPEDQPIS